MFDPDRELNLSPVESETVSALTLRVLLPDCVSPVTVAHCLHARLKIVNNRRKAQGICHGSIGALV